MISLVPPIVRRRWVSAATACLLIAAGPILADHSEFNPPRSAEPTEGELELLIPQALDQNTSFQIRNMPIRHALAYLSDKTGVPIEMEMHTVFLLPYGSETMLTATVEDHPLRDALTAMLQPLGLEFAAERDRVAVRPTPPLRRIARRATWQELEILEKLYSQPWSQELFESLQFQFQDAPAGDMAANRETLRRLAASVGAGSAAEVLNLATEQFGWTWYPSGDLITVLTRTRQVERQLERRIIERYPQKSLPDLLLDLATWGGVPLRVDPGALATVPAALAERFSFSMQNLTVREALEIIAGQTGLGYFIEPEGLRITANILSPSVAQEQEEAAARAVAALRSNAIVGQLTVHTEDGSTFAVFIRENDLPPDASELLRARISEFADRLAKELQEDTQPRD